MVRTLSAMMVSSRDITVSESMVTGRRPSPHVIAQAYHKVLCLAAGVNINDSVLSIATQRDAARHHAEAAVMAAHQRRSAERRSADIPRVLEVNLLARIHSGLFQCMQEN